MRSHGQNTISTGTKLVGLVGLTLAAAMATAGFGCSDSSGKAVAARAAAARAEPGDLRTCLPR